MKRVARPRFAALLFLPVLLASCGASEDNSLTIELGTGEAQFEPLEDLQTLPLVLGIQGGYHVWLSARISGTDAERVLMTLDLVPLSASEPPPARAPVRVFVEDDPEGTGRVLVGWPAVVDRPECLVGETLSLRVSFDDEAGRQGEAETRILIEGVPPEDC